MSNIEKHKGNMPAQKDQKLFFSMPTMQEMQHLIDFCKIMASAPFYQKLQAGGVMAIYLTAKEHNLPFMACLNGGCYTFDGKVTFSAQMINAMIVNAGHRVDVLHLDSFYCKIQFTRGDRKKGESDTFIYEYTMKDADKAGYLTKTNWKTSPKDMLFSRCITGGGRKFIPEVFVGVLVAGELVGDNTDSEIIPDTPVISDSYNTRIEPQKDIKQIPYDGYIEFMEKHYLNVTPEGENSRKREYVLETCAKSEMTEVQVINSAIKNEKIFEERFSIWEQKKYPRSESLIKEQITD